MVSAITVDMEYQADMEYQIITSKTLFGNDIGSINFPSLGEQGGKENLVKAEMKKGWMDIGGGLRGKADGEMVWAQMMVRKMRLISKSMLLTNPNQGE